MPHYDDRYGEDVCNLCGEIEIFCSCDAGDEEWFCLDDEDYGYQEDDGFDYWDCLSMRQ